MIAEIATYRAALDLIQAKVEPTLGAGVRVRIGINVMSGDTEPSTVYVQVVGADDLGVLHQFTPFPGITSIGAWLDWLAAAPT